LIGEINTDAFIPDTILLLSLTLSHKGRGKGENPDRRLSEGGLRRMEQIKNTHPSKMHMHFRKFVLSNLQRVGHSLSGEAVGIDYSN
jgi:hypothetical protein